MYGLFDARAVRMPGYVYLLVAGTMVLTAIVTILAGRRRRAREGTYNSEALGFVGGVLNALFIVVLAFYTVITWTAADSTEQHTESEASDLVEIYWQVVTAPEQSRTQVRALVTEYTKEVTDVEWPMLDRGEPDTKADDLLIALRSEITRLPTDSDENMSLRDSALDNVRNVADERRARVSEATSDSSLLTLLLVTTVIGAVLMVAFPLLIGFSADLRHIVSLAILAGLLAFAVYFSVELDQPLHGLIKVDPDAFRSALDEFGRIP
jgi:hypothetical protein